MSNGATLDPGVYEGKEDNRYYYVSKAKQVWNDRGYILGIENIKAFRRSVNFVKYVPSLEEFMKFLDEKSLKTE